MGTRERPSPRGAPARALCALGWESGCGAEPHVRNAKERGVGIPASDRVPGAPGARKGAEHVRG